MNYKMANQYTILVDAILNKTNLQAELNKIATSTSVKPVEIKAKIDLDSDQIEAQLNTWRNKLTSMQVGKSNIFNATEVKRDLTSLLNLIDTFGKEGGASVAQVNSAFGDLSTTVRVVKDNIESNAKSTEKSNSDTINNQRILAKLQEEASREDVKRTQEKLAIQQSLAGIENKRIDDIAKAQQMAYAEDQSRTQRKLNEGLAVDQTLANVENKRINDISKAQEMAYIEDRQRTQIKINEEMGLQQTLATYENKRIDNIGKAQEMAAVEDKARSQRKIDTEIGISKTLADYENKQIDALKKEGQAIADNTAKWEKQLQLLKTKNPDAFDTESVKNAEVQMQGVTAAYKNGTITQKEWKLGQMDLTNQVATTNKEISSAASNTDNWTTSIKKNFAKILEWGVGMTAIYGTLRQIQEGIQFIKDMDQQLTDIRIVSGMTSEEVKKMAWQFNALGKELSISGLEVAKGSLTWIRAGKSASDTAQLYH